MTTTEQDETLGNALFIVRLRVQLLIILSVHNLVYLRFENCLVRLSGVCSILLLANELFLSKDIGLFSDFISCFVVSAEKSLSQSFEVGPEGAKLLYYGAKINIPKGALQRKTTLILSIMKTGPPGKYCISPNIHFNCVPKVEHLFDPQVKITFPLNVSPIKVEDVSTWSQVSLMCLQKGLWTKLETRRMELSKMSFNCSHFCSYVLIAEQNDARNNIFSRSVHCFKKCEPGCLKLRVCIRKVGPEHAAVSSLLVLYNFTQKP